MVFRVWVYKELLGIRLCMTIDSLSLNCECIPQYEMHAHQAVYKAII
jgi:hypothetical protein